MITEKILNKLHAFGGRFGGGLIICLVLLTIFSCAKDDDDSTPVTQTVIVFFPYAENLTTNSSYLPADLTEIKNAIKNQGGTEGYRVIVYRGSSATTGEIFELQLNDKNIVEEKKLQSYTNIDQTSEADLKNIFSYIKSQTNTPTYKMIIGSHGCGWLPQEISYGAIKAPRHSFGGASQKNIRIDISTFANTLEYVGITPDVILFDACCMGNIETLWSMRKSAKYIVTIPSEQPAYGFNYQDIWTNILADATESNLIALCDKYKQYYQNNHKGYNTPSGESVSGANISVVNCQYLQPVAEAMKAINADAFASQNIKAILSNTSSPSIQRYDMKQTGIFYDLQSYAWAILQPETYSQGAVLYNNLTTALKSAVPYFTHSGYFIAKGNVCYPIAKENTCGISTSDPSTNTAITTYKQQTSWWNATH